MRSGRERREAQRDPGGVIWNDVTTGGTLALRTFISLISNFFLFPFTPAEIEAAV